MPQRRQLNVQLNESLLVKVKKDARRKGYTISEYISKLILQEPDEVDQDKLKLLSNRVSHLEENILKVSRDCPGQKNKTDTRPFNKEESINCTNFIKVFFKKSH